MRSTATSRAGRSSTCDPHTGRPVDGPAGQARHLSCFVQWAPYHLADGAVWDEKTRDAFGDAVVDVIAEHAPNIRDVILHRQVLSPLDIEETFGLTEGNIFQGELTLEQLFFNRPVPGWARYETPIKDLWLCGSATHPGGGIMGAPGKIAAERVIRAEARGGRCADDRVRRGGGGRRATTAWWPRPTWPRPA